VTQAFQHILVTGGTGLLGHAIQAIAGDHPESRFTFAGSRDCDLTRLDATVDYVRALKPDAVIHTALPLNPVFMAIPRHADPTAWLFYPWNRPERSARRLTLPPGQLTRIVVKRTRHEPAILARQPKIIPRITVGRTGQDSAGPVSTCPNPTIAKAGG